MSVSKEIKQKHIEMFYPTVRVRTQRAGGSGTVVYSKKNPVDGEVYTYVITNQHVVSDNIKVVKKWNPVLKRKVDTEILDTVSVEYFRYNNYSNCIGSFAVEADIVAYSEVEGGQDWALLRVRDTENTCDYVANLFPMNDIDDVHIFDPVYAVGASLGHPPIASEGIITYMDDEIDHYKYWMSSVAPSGFSSDAITHMGYFIPIERIYNLLDENNYNFIYDNDYTIEDCAKLRGETQDPKKQSDDSDEDKKD